MEIPVFNDEDDAYWWVICMDKYFDAMETPEEKKMTVVAKAIRGKAILWWFCWIHRHPEENWETFSWEFLWHFKPEFRDVLPLPPNEEGMLDLELDGSISRDDNRVGYCVQTEVKHEREVTATNSEDEMKERLQNEATPFTKCIIPMSKGHNESVIEFDGIVDATTEKQRSEKKSQSIFTIKGEIMLCVLLKNVTQNKVYDPGISSHVSHNALSLYFKVLSLDTYLIHHLEDKVNFKGGVLLDDDDYYYFYYYYYYYY
jgi:hypothetical protein